MEEEMEIEAADGSRGYSSSPSSKRLGLGSAIQTTFGDDYIFQIASNQEISTLAVSLSTNKIKFYSPSTGQYFGECKGHNGTIHEVSFSVPSSASIVCSCSSDGTVRAWDTRSFEQISLLKAGSLQEIFSFSFGGSSGNLLAAGSSAQILFWDWRNGKQMACLEEAHMDDVTQVRFAPSHHNKLISSSVDGLMCLFDTDGEINEDNDLLSVMNVGTSVSKIGFFGNSNQKLWCLTHIETLSIWDWNDARREANIEDARPLASKRWNLDHIDYLIDCHYSRSDDRLWVIGGTSSGSLGYFPVNRDPIGEIGSAEAILEGGHTGVVRTVLPVFAEHGSLVHQKGIFGWTGGEDGRVCCWSSDESKGSNCSWILSSFAMRSQKPRNRSRHHPY